jgi:uncharacterized protein (DUF1810 family)
MKNQTPSCDLERFVEAQAEVYETALWELRAGCKESHWMWFIFPQFAGLGSSVMSRRYAISTLDEAKAYLRHPVLGPRLIECTRAVLDSGENLSTLLPYPDDLKFRSCMTLFATASEGREPFDEALLRFFGGHPDHETLKLLRESAPPFSTPASNPVAQDTRTR